MLRRPLRPLHSQVPDGRTVVVQAPQAVTPARVLALTAQVTDTR